MYIYLVLSCYCLYSQPTKTNMTTSYNININWPPGCRAPLDQRCCHLPPELCYWRPSLCQVPGHVEEILHHQYWMAERS